MDEEKSVKSKGIKSLTHFLFSQRRNKFSRTLLLIKIFFLKICSDICRQTFRSHYFIESATSRAGPVFTILSVVPFVSVKERSFPSYIKVYMFAIQKALFICFVASMCVELRFKRNPGYGVTIF